MEENTNNAGEGVKNSNTQEDSSSAGSVAPVVEGQIVPTESVAPVAPVTEPVAPQSAPASAEAPAVQQPIQVPEILKAAHNQPSVTSDEKIWGLVSYIPLMALMALVLKPSSDFIKLHGRQGLLIFLIFFFSIFIYLVPFIGPLIGVIIHFAMIGIGLFSMFQAFIGNWWKIPVLGDISELIPVELFAKVTREAVVGAKVSEEIEQKSIEEEQAKAEEAAIMNEANQVVEDSPVISVDNTPNPEETNEPQEVPPVVTDNAPKADVQQQLPMSGEEGVSEANK